MRLVIPATICLLLTFARSSGAQVVSPPSAPSGLALSADDAREIWDTGFRQKRPAGSHPATATAHYTPSSNRNVPAGSPAKASQAAIGFTIWRLRPPNANDRDGARILVEDLGTGPSAIDFVPERINDATPLHVGDRIRLSLEVPRAGFLYVIDRERYRDGSTGDPILIFPTLNMNHGDNEVVPGRLVEIPPQNGRVHALRIARSNDQHIGEDLIVIVAAQPLPGIALTEDAQPLAPSQVTSWDHDWGIKSLALNLNGGDHQVWSVTEQKVGKSPLSSVLTQNDPMPQTIVSVAPQTRSRPLLVHLSLEIQ